jgi:hypothetical protein
MTACERFQAMPWLLRIACLASLLLGVFMALSACLPFATFEIFDEQVTGRQLWAFGYGPFVLLSGFALLAAGVGLLQGRGWSRWIIVFIHAFLIPFAVIYWLRRRENLGILLFETFVLGGLWAWFFFWYLFRRQRSLFT